MIVDCSMIRNGGGLILLKELIIEAKKVNKKIVFLLHPEVSENFDVRKLIVRNILHRELVCFYLSFFHRSYFSFCNISTFFKFFSKELIYFQNVEYFRANKELAWIVKSVFFKRLLKRHVILCCQTDEVKKKLVSFGFNKVAVLPFFKDLDQSKDANFHKFKKRKKNIVLFYPADGHFYKNHLWLLERLYEFSDIETQLKIYTTIGENYLNLISEVDNFRKKGIYLNNLGHLDHQTCVNHISSADILIFLSSYESFGLPLIEAAQLGIPVVAPNLAYVSSVIDTEYLFDLGNPLSFELALRKAINYRKSPVIKVGNDRECLRQILGESFEI